MDSETRSPGTITTRVTRTIAADPTSTALLLAGPAALELWPGVRRLGEVGGRALVEAHLDQSLAAAAVKALPPRRTPTAFVTRFQWTGPGLPATDGELVLAYAPAADGAAMTHAALVLDSTGLGGSRLDAPTLRRMATGFLDNLAEAAESRSDAA